VLKGPDRWTNKILPVAIHNQTPKTVAGINSKFYKAQQSAGLHIIPVKMRDTAT
jgi:hypothetical protein